MNKTRPHKYKPGPRARDILELIAWIQADRWIYLSDRPKSPRVLANMSVATLGRLLRSGTVRLAIDNVEVSNAE
jgi:hypothetical protein